MIDAEQTELRQRLRDLRNHERDSFPVYSTHELARMLGVKVDTLRKWRIEGRGPPFVRESKRTCVYIKASVEQWLKRTEQRIQTVEKRRKKHRRRK